MSIEARGLAPPVRPLCVPNWRITMHLDPEPLFIRGNMHLGGDYHTWSIPARLTCKLGMTDVCLAVCYALDFFFLTPTAKRKHGRNYERAQDTIQFVNDALAEIRYKRVKKLRVHVGGDFFSLEYIDAWFTIAKRCKSTKFLFYTRAWRSPEAEPKLEALAALSNVYAFWSEDRDTGPCTISVGRRAFLCTNIQDELLVPPGVLVFRHRTTTVRKFINGAWVCAKEQGTKTGITCSACGVCVSREPLPVPPERRDRDGSASAAQESEDAPA